MATDGHSYAFSGTFTSDLYRDNINSHRVFDPTRTRANRALSVQDGYFTSIDNSRRPYDRQYRYIWHIAVSDTYTLFDSWA